MRHWTQKARVRHFFLFLLYLKKKKKKIASFESNISIVLSNRECFRIFLCSCFILFYFSILEVFEPFESIQHHPFTQSPTVLYYYHRPKGHPHIAQFSLVSLFFSYSVISFQSVHRSPIAVLY